MLARRVRLFLLFLLALLAAGCGGGGGSPGFVIVAGGGFPGPADPPAPAGPVGLITVASGLDRPMFLGAPDGDPRSFIALRAGRIVVLQNGSVMPQPFLDISANVSAAGEGGLLSLAFDPQYAANGYFYVYYTDLAQDIVVERFRAEASTNHADPASGLVILRIPHPGYTNHYGGMLAFGPDGNLYLAPGDGGGEGDPQNNGRNLGTLLGKMLRIDVRHASAAAPYAIPPSNPYAGQPRVRPEIWASGLRNPWRFAFDGRQLYIADVGQDLREEVDIADAARGGLDYGWSTMEGTRCVRDDCDRTGLTLPVFEYGHASLPGDGTCAIIGGFVYRGSALPELAGRYFYSDLCAGFLASFRFANGVVVDQLQWAVQPVGQVVSFGRDGQGELYLIAASGTIYKIGRSGALKS